jgi:cytochrome c peroxidase
MSMKVKSIVVFAVLATLALALVLVGQGLAGPELTGIEELGQLLYFDEDLSEPSGQSCASCHHPDFGFADPDRGIPVSEGVILGEFGDRNSPSSAYAMYAPILYFDEGEGLWIGGQFWDGRATGDELGDPLADQALGPFLNSVEMHNPDKDTVIRDVAASDYAGLFEEVWGAESLDDVEVAYDQVALSIAAFERTSQFGQFNSKYDHYLEACLQADGDMDDCAKGIGHIATGIGDKFFTKKEWYGMQLFMGENDNDGTLDKGEGAMCAACHVADFTPAMGNVIVPSWAPDGMVPPVFTDFTFDNLGVPANPRVAELTGNSGVDLGLGPIVGDPEENGKFKVMTLRNIHLTAPYAHNGFFKKLEDITHFYNTRDSLPLCDDDVVKKAKPGVNCWDASEYPDTKNIDELGDLGLSDKDEEALVKFMKTLSDGWMP